MTALLEYYLNNIRKNQEYKLYKVVKKSVRHIFLSLKMKAY